MKASVVDIIDYFLIKKLIKNCTAKDWVQWEKDGVIPDKCKRGDKFDFECVVKRLKKAKKLKNLDESLTIDDISLEFQKFLESGKKKLPKSGVQRIEELPMPGPGHTAESYKIDAKRHMLDGDPTLTEANIFKTIYQGKLAQLKYEVEKEMLVSKEEVRVAAFKMARTARDHILAIPERISGELASITDPVEIRERLYAELLSAMVEIVNE